VKLHQIYYCYLESGLDVIEGVFSSSAKGRLMGDRGKVILEGKVLSVHITLFSRKTSFKYYPDKPSFRTSFHMGLPGINRSHRELPF